MEYSNTKSSVSDMVSHLHRSKTVWAVVHMKRWILVFSNTDSILWTVCQTPEQRDISAESTLMSFSLFPCSSLTSASQVFLINSLACLDTDVLHALQEGCLHYGIFFHIHTS